MEILSEEDKHIHPILGYPVGYARLCTYSVLKKGIFMPYSKGPPQYFLPYAISLEDKKKVQELDSLFVRVPEDERDDPNTTSFKDALWRRLPHLEAAGFDSDLFRVDCYGNVLYRDADDGSPLAWTIDHWFPRCRGGLTVLDNLHVVQRLANARKHGRLEFLIPHWELSVGVSVELFLTVFSSDNDDFRDRAQALFFKKEEADCAANKQLDSVFHHRFPPQFNSRKREVGRSAAAIGNVPSMFTLVATSVSSSNARSKRLQITWTKEEEEALKRSVANHGDCSWEIIQKNELALMRKTPGQCKDKWFKLEKRNGNIHVKPEICDSNTEEVEEDNEPVEDETTEGDMIQLQEEIMENNIYLQAEEEKLLHLKHATAEARGRRAQQEQRRKELSRRIRDMQYQMKELIELGDIDQETCLDLEVQLKKTEAALYDAQSKSASSQNNNNSMLSIIPYRSPENHVISKEALMVVEGEKKRIASESEDIQNPIADTSHVDFTENSEYRVSKIQRIIQKTQDNEKQTEQREDSAKEQKCLTNKEETAGSSKPPLSTRQVSSKKQLFVDMGVIPNSVTTFTGQGTLNTNGSTGSDTRFYFPLQTPASPIPVAHLNSFEPTESDWDLCPWGRSSLDASIQASLRGSRASLNSDVGESTLTTVAVKADLVSKEVETQDSDNLELKTAIQSISNVMEKNEDGEVALFENDMLQEKNQIHGVTNLTLAEKKSGGGRRLKRSFSNRARAPKLAPLAIPQQDEAVILEDYLSDEENEEVFETEKDAADDDGEIDVMSALAELKAIEFADETPEQPQEDENDKENLSPSFASFQHQSQQQGVSLSAIKTSAENVTSKLETGSHETDSLPASEKGSINLKKAISKESQLDVLLVPEETTSETISGEIKSVTVQSDKSPFVLKTGSFKEEEDIVFQTGGLDDFTIVSKFGVLETIENDVNTKSGPTNHLKQRNPVNSQDRKDVPVGVLEPSTSLNSNIPTFPSRIPSKRFPYATEMSENVPPENVQQRGAAISEVQQWVEQAAANSDVNINNLASRDSLVRAFAQLLSVPPGTPPMAETTPSTSIFLQQNASPMAPMAPPPTPAGQTLSLSQPLSPGALGPILACFAEQGILPWTAPSGLPPTPNCPPPTPSVGNDFLLSLITPTRIADHLQPYAIQEDESSSSTPFGEVDIKNNYSLSFSSTPPASPFKTPPEVPQTPPTPPPLLSPSKNSLTPPVSPLLPAPPPPTPAATPGPKSLSSDKSFSTPVTKTITKPSPEMSQIPTFSRASPVNQRTPPTSAMTSSSSILSKPSPSILLNLVATRLLEEERGSKIGKQTPPRRSNHLKLVEAFREEQERQERLQKSLSLRSLPSERNNIYPGLSSQKFQDDERQERLKKTLSLRSLAPDYISNQTSGKHESRGNTKFSTETEKRRNASSPQVSPSPSSNPQYKRHTVGETTGHLNGHSRTSAMGRDVEHMRGVMENGTNSPSCGLERMRSLTPPKSDSYIAFSQKPPVNFPHETNHFPSSGGMRHDHQVQKPHGGQMMYSSPSPQRVREYQENVHSYNDQGRNLEGRRWSGHNNRSPYRGRRYMKEGDNWHEDMEGMAPISRGGSSDLDIHKMELQSPRNIMAHDECCACGYNAESDRSSEQGNHGYDQMGYYREQIKPDIYNQNGGYREHQYHHGPSDAHRQQEFLVEDRSVSPYGHGNGHWKQEYSKTLPAKFGNSMQGDRDRDFNKWGTIGGSRDQPKPRGEITTVRRKLKTVKMSTVAHHGLESSCNSRNTGSKFHEGPEPVPEMLLVVQPDRSQREGEEEEDGRLEIEANQGPELTKQERLIGYGERIKDTGGVWDASRALVMVDKEEEGEERSVKKWWVDDQSLQVTPLRERPGGLDNQDRSLSDMSDGKGVKKTDSNRFNEGNRGEATNGGGWLFYKAAFHPMG